MKLAPADFYFDVHQHYLNAKPPEDPRLAREFFSSLESNSLSLIGFPPLELSEVREAWEDVRRWQDRGYHLLMPGDAAWPKEAFRGMSDPPRGLFVWGDAQVLRTPLLAVVGSRDPSRPTLEWLESELSEFLRQNPDVNLVSGGARGVDQCAHRASLRKGRPTVAFVPSGFQKLYPPELDRWSEDVRAKGGCYVSEYSPLMPMRKSNFGERNRLISAISKAVLIVEARRRSGTLLTAKAAADQARAVFVVPGTPYDSQFAGSLDLIAEGATMVRDAQELSVFFRVEIRNSYYALKGSSMDSEVLRLTH